MKYKVFISHSSKDTWVVRQIEKHVRSLDCNTFLDYDNIKVGDDFESVILKELRNSNELLVLFTPWAKQRPYVWLEIGAAWGLGIRIIGVLHGITYQEILEDGSNPAFLKSRDLIELNEIDILFNQMDERIKQNGNQ